MLKPDSKDSFLYLLTCSKRSLGHFLLTRLEEHSRLKKDLMLIVEAELDRMVENLAEIRMANLLRDHGEEIISRLTSSPLELPYEPHRLPPTPVGKKKAI